MCVVSLAPQSPLVAPIALLYYFVCVPLWRRNCIFLYRPKFDTGEERWPFLSDMIITSGFNIVRGDVRLESIGGRD